jgi:hypothetical protein
MCVCVAGGPGPLPCFNYSIACISQIPTRPYLLTTAVWLPPGSDATRPAYCAQCCFGDKFAALLEDTKVQLADGR